MLTLCALSAAFTLPSHQLLRPTGLRAHDAPQMALNTRREALLAAGAACLVGLPGVQSASAEEFKSKTGKVIEYTKLVSGDEKAGGMPKVGDLVAIRFKGAVKATGSVFDDILGSPEPYYMRLGRSRRPFLRALPHCSCPARSRSPPTAFPLRIDPRAPSGAPRALCASLPQLTAIFGAQRQRACRGGGDPPVDAHG